MGGEEEEGEGGQGAWGCFGHSQISATYLCGRQGELGERPYLKDRAADLHGQEDEQDVVQTEQSHQEEGGFDQCPARGTGF